MHVLIRKVETFSSQLAENKVLIILYIMLPVHIPD